METSQFKLIDTHCHLYASEFDHDRSELISKAIDSGIHQMMLPNIDIGTIPSMNKLTGQFPGHCFAMMGLHPCSVREDYEEDLQQMRTELVNGDYKGIGETGIDLYWDTTYKEYQINAFEQQIEWAKEFDLPVIIHSRESLDLNIEIIAAHQDGHLRGIFHCFGGNEEQARRIDALGFKLGIGGIVTFKKSPLNEVLPKVASGMIVLETDAPYLAPTPHRGKRNEPAFLILIAEKLAEILQLPLKDVADMTSANARAVFTNMD